MNKKLVRGFTLIELLVVIAIIAILASIVLASLNSARVKSRDARRIADIKQIQTALELYNNDFGTYPSSTTQLVPNYISVLPKDPSTNANYSYAGLQGTASSVATCGSYHLGATIEGTTPNTKVGAGTATICTGSGADFDGTGAQVYDVKP